jgi:hypothetical protein
MKTLLLGIILFCLPLQAQFPTTVATRNDLLYANNFFQAKLSTIISQDDLTLPIKNQQFSLNFPTILTIDNEVVKVCSESSNIITVCSGGRGFDSTTASIHNIDASIKAATISAYHNLLTSEIIAVETSVKNNGIIQDIGYSSFVSAYAAAAAAGKPLNVASSWVAVPSGTYANLVFLSGGILHLATAATVNIAGSFSCPVTQQCFDTSASGSAVVFNTYPTAIYPDWFGAKPSGTNSPAVDSSAAFNAAAVAAGSNSIGRAYAKNIRMNCGTYSIAATVTFSQMYGADIGGCTDGATILAWTGNSSDPTFFVTGSSISRFHDFRLIYSPSNPAALAISIFQPSIGGSSRNSFSDITIEGQQALTDVFKVWGVLDANNDFMLFERIQAYGYLHAGTLLYGTQSYSNQFKDCTFSGDRKAGDGQYGVIAANATGTVGNQMASFQWHGGFMATSVADFYLLGATDSPIILEGLDSESTGMALLSVAGQFIKTVIKNARWNRVCETRYFPCTNKDFIDYQGALLEIEDSSFAAILYDGTTSTQDYNMTIRYRANPTVESLPGVTIKNVNITTTNKTINSVFANGDQPANNLVRYSDFSWIDSGFVTGYYGNKRTFSPIASITGNASNATTIAGGSSQFITVNNAAATILAILDGGGNSGVGDIKYLQVQDSITSVFNAAANPTGHNIYFNPVSYDAYPSILLRPGQTYMFMCIGVSPSYPTGAIWTLLNPGR